ncbi:MAG: ribokinase [Candidatus Acidiferrales bacterium]
MSAKIIVVGSLNTDLVACASRIPVAGETITGHTFLSACGGKGANQAYAAARLGAHVEMIGRVGNDDFAKQMRANLENAGCDTAGVKAISGVSSGIALIFVGDSGQNSIVVVPGANERLTPADIEASKQRFTGASALLLQLETPLATVQAAAAAARAAGVRVILDPAPAPSKALPAELVRLVDVLTPNESEAAILAGLPPGRMNVAQAFDIAKKLQQLGPRTVIVKLGDQGCALRDGEAEHALPAPSVKAVDTTAAGDVFNAALAVALGEGADMVAACRSANRAAALSVTRRGAQPAAPSRAELDAFAP